MGRFSRGDSGRGDYFWGDSEPHPENWKTVLTLGGKLMVDFSGWKMAG